MLLASSPLRAEDVETPSDAKVEAVFRGREQPQQPQEANDRLRDSKQLWPILASYYTQVRFYKDQSFFLFFLFSFIVLFHLKFKTNRFFDIDFIYKVQIEKCYSLLENYNITYRVYIKYWIFNILLYVIFSMLIPLFPLNVCFFASAGDQKPTMY